MGDKKGRTTFHDVYDLSPDQREVIEWKHKRRLELREQFLRLRGDPAKRSHIFDAAIQRQYTAIFSYDSIFKPTLRNFGWNISLIVIPFLTLAYIVKNERDEKEYRYRSGQVSYKDRDWKFA